MKNSGVERPARVVLDTSAYARMRAGHAGVHDWAVRADALFLTTIALGELEAGFRLGNRYAENRQVLDDFLEEPFASVLEVTRETARRYGLLFYELRRAGMPIPTNDIWIAALTMESGAHLLTFDGDFARINGLEHTVMH